MYCIIGKTTTEVMSCPFQCPHSRRPLMSMCRITAEAKLFFSLLFFLCNQKEYVVGRCFETKKTRISHHTFVPCL